MKKACPEIYGHNINWNFSSLNKRNDFYSWQNMNDVYIKDVRILFQQICRF